MCVNPTIALISVTQILISQQLDLNVLNFSVPEVCFYSTWVKGKPINSLQNSPQSRLAAHRSGFKRAKINIIAGSRVMRMSRHYLENQTSAKICPIKMVILAWLAAALQIDLASEELPRRSSKLSKSYPALNISWGLSGWRMSQVAARRTVLQSGSSHASLAWLSGWDGLSQQQMVSPELLPLVPFILTNSVTKSGQKHPPLTESSEVNQPEISQTKASWDAKGHGYQLVLSPPDFNQL